MTRIPASRLALVAALALGALPAFSAQVLVPPGATLSVPAGMLVLFCSDLIVQGTLSAGSSQVGTAGNVTIAAGGTLNAGASTLTVGGNWANSGAFAAGTSTVAFVDGCTTSPAQLTGTTAFTNLTFASNVGRSFTLPTGGATSVAGVLTLSGASAAPIQLVSANPSQLASIVFGVGGSVAQSHVQLGTNVVLDGSALPRLANISTRMQVLTGNDVMIGGFVIGGSANKTVAIVATGPSLTPFGITNPLANPTITLVRSSDQVVIASNDNWAAASNAAQLQAAGFAPSSTFEAGILANLAPGAYTAIVEGVGGGIGTSVIGVYEVDGTTIPLINISTRGRVLTGNDVMIGGFIIQGAAPQTVAVVATGPSLANFGIANPLANPTITLVRSSDQAVIATNDDWQTDTNSSQLQAAGFAPSNALESGLYITLPPGAYTAILSGVAGGTGVGVIGVYKVN